MKIGSILGKIFLCSSCVIALAPYVLMIICCFSTSESIKGNALFSDLSFENLTNNFTMLFGRENFWVSIGNSMFISTIASIIGVIVASLVAYSSLAFSGKINKFVNKIAIAAMLIPEATLLVPLFVFYRELHLLNTYIGVIIASLSLPFLIFLFKQSSENFSPELIKASRIDGTSEIKIYFRVYLPVMKDVIIAGIIIAFVNAWNSALIPVVIIQSKELMTNTIFLNALGSIWFNDYAMLMLGLVLSTVPVILIFLMCSKPFSRAIIK